MKDPENLKTASSVFNEAPFIADVGIRLEGLGSGWCESVLDLEPRHLQHTGVVHAGVQATIADHTAGAAASTVVGPGEFVLSLEFKLNLLRPARGERLQCRADVVKAGSRFSYVESLVHAIQGENRILVSKAALTMAVLPKKAKSEK